MEMEKIGATDVPELNPIRWAVRADLEAVRAAGRFWRQFEPNFRKIAKRPFFAHLIGLRIGTRELGSSRHT